MSVLNSIIVFAVSASTMNVAVAAKKSPTPRNADVQSVKSTYWNRNSDGDVEVVQNRLYSKSGRISLQPTFGTVSSDPFLSVKSGALSLGYHFSESFGIQAVGRKYFVSKSSYQKELEEGLTAGAAAKANVNAPRSYLGGEIMWSPLYGKISLGGGVTHYDAHIFVGAGVTDTETGKLFTPSVGLGPQFYLGKSVALNVDYRLSYYKETIPEQVLTSSKTAGERDNFSHQFTLGMTLYL